MLTADDRVVVVGASLGGLRAAEALRAEGFTGPITIVGDEAEPPYDRPALSKSVLAGRLPADAVGLPAARDDLRAEWILGNGATALDTRRRAVTLADGRELGYEALVVATGTRARAWPDPDEAALEGVYTVRTRSDAAVLQARLAAPTRRVLVIGAGFIGSEVASIARERGHEVTVAERGAGPLINALGGPAATVATRLQRRAGVDLRTSVSVLGLEGDDDGRLVRARLSDGDHVDVDVAVVALGATRNVEWLAGSGLSVDHGGVVCDAACRAFDDRGAVTGRVVVVGDVARWPHPMVDGELVAVEHWQNAVDQAAVAAHNLVTAPDDLAVHDSLPVFWSNQFGVNIKSVGLPSAADQVVLTQGSVADLRFVAAYGRAGRLIGAVAFDTPRALDAYGALISARAPFPPPFTAADAPRTARVLPAAFPNPAVPTHGPAGGLAGAGLSSAVPVPDDARIPPGAHPL